MSPAWKSPSCAARAKAVRALADNTVSQRGVRHGHLHLVPAESARGRHSHGGGPHEHEHIHA